MKLLLLFPLLVFCSTGEGKQYKVIVKTASDQYSGTDANVWIKIHGKNGVTGMGLDNPGKDDFEAGSTDEFSVEGADVGPIEAVSVKRDNSGSHPGWKLLTIDVTYRDAGIETGYVVGFRMWVDANTWIKRNVSTVGPDGR